MTADADAVRVTPFDGCEPWGGATRSRGLVVPHQLFVAVAGCVAALAVVALMMAAGRVDHLLPKTATPLPELAVERVVFRPGEIVVGVRNTGPVAAQIRQVAVDDAFRAFQAAEGGRLDRLASTELRIPYPWIAGEPVHLSLLAADGTAFDHEVAAAALTPTATRDTVVGYAAVGSFVGVVPVFAGLALLPLIGRLRSGGIRFLLGLTAGMLVFLAVDAFGEAREAAAGLAPVFRGDALVRAGVAGTAGLLLALRRGSTASMERNGLRTLPYLVAGSIGLHNLGEGLAIGSAHAQGKLALSAALVAGFAVHNLTEGIGIGAATSGHRPSGPAVLALGALAGLPTVAGTLIGGFAYSPFLGALFLGIGAGAVLPVLLELARRLSAGADVAAPLAGVAGGYVVMYLTALVVAA